MELSPQPRQLRDFYYKTALTLPAEQRKKGSEAYRGHFDTDDVLVIHLAGERKWRVHERQAPPRVDMSEMTPAQMGLLHAEFVLRPGDALYLRSGTPHRVETSGGWLFASHVV